jgi:o-succinylbenzoate---CoA ligase
VNSSADSLARHGSVSARCGNRPANSYADIVRELVAIDAPGDQRFPRLLQRIWDRHDAAFVIDRRLPPVARQRLLAGIRPTQVVDGSGDYTRLDGGEPVEEGDALVVTTSGSSGEPKGAVLTHTAIAASALVSSRRLGVTHDDHWLACLPLAHIGGLSVITRAILTGTALTVHDHFDPAAVRASPATLVSLVTTALQRTDASRFRVVLLGGSRPAPQRPPNAVTTYGMTETGSGIVYDGAALDDVEVRIDDAGEIGVRGPMLLRCYRGSGDPKTPDGWFATGDLGRWLPDGRLHVDGRIADVIVTGGEKVWPQTVETALAGHPGILDVAVAGIADDHWGSVVTAFVVPDPADRPTLSQLRDRVKHSLPAYAAPQRLVFVGSIPRTSLGKPRRSELLGALEQAPSAPPSDRRVAVTEGLQQAARSERGGQMDAPATPAPPSIK